jgi:lipid-binding SYLF domain-containing protein
MRCSKTLAGLLVACLWLATAPLARAADAVALERDSRAAMEQLYASVPAARALADKAVGILVFPRVVKAGLMIGGQYGEGVLFEQGTRAGLYSTAGASYGLQAGAQSYGYVMLFMSRAALGYLSRADGFEVGVGPSVVVVDEGLARNLTTTTAGDDVYAFIFGQKGLMAGLGLQGNKITRLD